jgi:hypothetical protein
MLASCRITAPVAPIRADRTPAMAGLALAHTGPGVQWQYKRHSFAS